jgi:hypothetical protein
MLLSFKWWCWNILEESWIGAILYVRRENDMSDCIMLPHLYIQWIFKYNFIGIRDIQVLRMLCLPQFLVFPQNFLLIRMTTLINAFLFRFSDLVEAPRLSCQTHLHTMGLILFFHLLPVNVIFHLFANSIKHNIF